ncbi:MAG: phosphatidylglycerophosphatase A [Pirellulales bacterium]
MNERTSASNGSPHWLSPTVLVATCGGVGRLGLAPGTAGAAVGAFAAALLATWELPFFVEFGVLVCVNCIGVPICSRAASLLGKGSDPGAIVYDEAASLPLGLLVIAPEARSSVVIACAFLLHRVFDISKLPPGRQLERLPSGLGIMADDWAAAAWTAGVLVLFKVFQSTLGVVWF